MKGRIEELIDLLNKMGFSDIKVTVRLQNNAVKVMIVMYDRIERYTENEK